MLNGLEFEEADAAVYNETDERGKYLTRSLKLNRAVEDRQEVVQACIMK